MSDREILVRWLAAIAVRLRRRAAVRELGRLACALFGLLFLWQLTAAAAVPVPVRAALLPLFLMAALVAALAWAWRARRSASLEQAAAEADARAGLKDEIKSAHWFSVEPMPEGQSRTDELVRLLVARAAATARQVDTLRLIPLSVPRSAFAALVLAAGTVGLMSFPPYPVPAPAMALAAVDASRASMPTPAQQAKASLAEPLTVTVVAPERAEQEHGSASAPTLEPQADAPADKGGIEEARTAADAALAGQTAQARDAAAAPQTLRLSGLDLSTLVQASAAEATEEPVKPQHWGTNQERSGAFAEPMARMTREMREQIRKERRKLGGAPAQGDVEYNPRMRAIRRDSVGVNELVEAQGQAADAGSQTSVDGDAKGSPDGKAKAGGTSGEHPESSEVTEVDSQPVLGERSARLAAQAEQVRVDRAGELQPGAAKEAFYAATRRRAAQTGYQAVDARSRTE
jgi:hypothetical protein